MEKGGMALPPHLTPSAPAVPRRRPLWRRCVRWALYAVLAFHAWYVGATTLLVACYAFVDPPVTTLALERKFVQGWTIRRPYPVSYAGIPKTARRMLVSVEDGKFWEHHGIDLAAIEHAREINESIGRPLYGGSTLTMQLARTLFLVPVKSYFRKYLELIVTVELEVLLSKERILELYFSWAEWGKGVFGIEAAAKLYYKASVSKLGVDSLARLMAILSSPVKYSPSTLGKSRLLTERYTYLIRKYGG